VAKLLEFEINASAFFMEIDQLTALENEESGNVIDDAFEDCSTRSLQKSEGRSFPSNRKLKLLPRLLKFLWRQNYHQRHGLIF